MSSWKYVLFVVVFITSFVYQLYIGLCNNIEQDSNYIEAPIVKIPAEEPEKYLKTAPEIYYYSKIKQLLTPDELAAVQPVANSLHGTIVDKTWQLMEFEEKHFTFTRDTDESKINIQTPSEFYRNKRGSSFDYAVFTAAVLLDSGINPVYVVVIRNHAYVLVDINGKRYGLDRQLPIQEEFATDYRITLEDSKKLVLNNWKYIIEIRKQDSGLKVYVNRTIIDTFFPTHVPTDDYMPKLTYWTNYYLGCSPSRNGHYMTSIIFNDIYLSDNSPYVRYYGKWLASRLADSVLSIDGGYVKIHETFHGTVAKVYET